MTTVQMMAAFMGIVLVVLFVVNGWGPEKRAVAG
jgi:hypothetical protein